MLVRLLITTLSCWLTTFATSQCSFTLSFTMSGTDGKTETESYKSTKAFQDTFHRFQFTNPKMGKTFWATDLPKCHVDPTIVYIAKHPFLKACLEEYSYNQVADKAFEDKACAALEHHLQSYSIWCCVPTIQLDQMAGASLQGWMMLLNGKGFGRASMDMFFPKV